MRIYLLIKLFDGGPVRSNTQRCCLCKYLCIDLPPHKIECVSIGVIWYHFGLLQAPLCRSRCNRRGLRRYVIAAQAVTNSELFPMLRDERLTMNCRPLLVCTAALWSSVWCRVIYNVCWTVHLRLPREHVPVTMCDLCLWVCVWLWGGVVSSVPKPLVNEDSPHNKRTVLLTSLGMCGLKLNTGLLSGKPGALSYLFCIFMKTPILWCPLSEGGGLFAAKLMPFGGGCWLLCNSRSFARFLTVGFKAVTEY